MIGRVGASGGMRAFEGFAAGEPAVVVAEVSPSLGGGCLPFSTLSRCNSGIVPPRDIAPPTVTRAAYDDIDGRLRDLNASGIHDMYAAAVAQARDSGEATRRYGQYLQGQYVLSDQAAVLTVATTGSTAGIGETLGTFHAMRKYDDMNQARAALLTTTPDPVASYKVFRGFVDGGLDRDVAALLAQSVYPDVARRAYDSIIASGGMSPRDAAMVASVGASAAEDTKTIVDTARDLHDRPVLAAALLASNKTATQLRSASDHFGGADADLTAAAWAVLDGHAMACIASARFMR